MFHLVESFPLGNKRITQEKQRKEIRGWRAEEKAVRAKALYNYDVFPPCMIIQIVGFLAKAFP